MPDLQAILDLLLRPEVALPVFLTGLLLAFWAGRRTSDRAMQVSELEGALHDLRQERQQAQDGQDQAVEELGAYKGRVAEHFTETSEKLHELTLQYRAVYDHLAAGAGELCPESLEKLDGGLGLDSLPSGEASSDEAGSEGEDASSTGDDPARTTGFAPELETDSDGEPPRPVGEPGKASEAGS